MVAGGRARNAVAALLGPRRREPVRDTAHLERARVLEQLRLEPEPGRDVGAVEERRAPDAPADRLGGAHDIVARERIAAHAAILDTLPYAECNPWTVSTTMCLPSQRPLPGATGRGTRSRSASRTTSAGRGFSSRSGRSSSRRTSAGSRSGPFLVAPRRRRGVAGRARVGPRARAAERLPGRVRPGPQRTSRRSCTSSAARTPASSGARAATRSTSPSRRAPASAGSASWRGSRSPSPLSSSHPSS